MEFKREEYSEGLVAEIWPLLEEHYQEIAHFQDIPLAPDFEAYRNAEKLGVVRIFTARDQGRLDGYAIYFLRRNIHYQTSLQAVQDILFLSAGLRRGLAGYRFIKWCDEQLKKENVQVVYQHVKLAHNFGPVLERIGYEPVEVTYVRRLDPWDSQQL